VAVQGWLQGQVDGGHAALGDPGDDLVGAKGLADEIIHVPGCHLLLQILYGSVSSVDQSLC